MRRFINGLACATVLCIAGTSGARAQHAPTPALYNWTGFYAGLNGGIGGGVASPTHDLSAAPNNLNHFPGFTSIDAQTYRLGGFLAGGQAGYNYQFRNHVVLGVESDLQWSDIRASNRNDSAVSLNAGSPFPINLLTSANMAISQNWFGTTRLRLGYQFADRLLAYVTGGVAYSGFTASNSGLGTQLSSPPLDYSTTSGATTSTRIGWAAGAGFEYALNSHLSIKSEYLYSEYGSLTAPYLNATPFATPTATNGTFSTGTLGIHLVRAGLNYRFGEPGEAATISRLIDNTPSPPSFIWSGFYAGVNGGYGGGVANPMLSEVSVVQLMFGPGQTNTSSVNERLRASGFSIGGQLGYNRLVSNRFLIGMETDLQWSDIRASSRSNLSGVYNPPGLLAFSSNSSTTVAQDWFGTTRLRLGYLVSDRFLTYATGGVAYAAVAADNSGASGDNGGSTSITTTTGPRNTARLGWTAGAGAEYVIGANLSFKTEYLYSQYSGLTVPYQTTGSTTFSTTATQGTLATGTLGIHLVRAGLNWKLGDSSR